MSGAQERRIRRRILVVEDEALISLLIRQMIEQMGDECVGPFAETSPAIKVIETEPLDAALLDVGLVNSDSYPIAAALDSRHIPFAFLTGYPSLFISKKWADRPCLPKPFFDGDLESILRAIVLPESAE